MRAVLLVCTGLLLFTGCKKSIQIPDACVMYPGRSCISLAVLSPAPSLATLDQLKFVFDGSLGGTTQMTPTVARTFSLPVVVPILPSSSFAGGNFSFAVVGLLQQNPIGENQVTGTLTPGQHLALSTTLEPFSRSDMAVPADQLPIVVTAPRPIWPLSTGHVTSLTPTFKWALSAGSDGAHVDICGDRACQTVLGSSFDASGDTGSASSPLPANTTLFWRARSLSGGQTVSDFGVVWEFTTSKLTPTATSSYGSVMDVNGDGLADLAVGAPSGYGSAAASPGIGTVLVYHGSQSPTWKASPPKIAVTLTEPNGLKGTLFGASVADAGDVNGDGYADLVVGAPMYNVNGASAVGAGAAYVFLGSASGLKTDAIVLSLPGANPKDQFGGSVAGVGDVDGDGYADIAVGAPGFANRIGKVAVFRGGPNGVVSTPAWTMSPSNATNSTFGNSVAAAGDVDGDGYSDLLVAAQGENSSTGAVYLYRGGADGLGANGNVVTPLRIAGDTGDDGFGYSVAGLGDIDGDGFCDIAIGESFNSNSGDVFVYRGSAKGIDPAQTRGDLKNPRTGGTELYAWTIAGADINNDGRADVIVGAPSANSGGNGYAYVFFSGSGTAWPLTRVTAQTNDQFGYSMRAFGDADGDHFVDVFIGAPGVSSGAGEGDLFLFDNAAMSSVGKTADFALTAAGVSNYGY